MKPRRPRRREPAWTRLDDEALLDLRFCDLRLSLASAGLEDAVQRLYEELRRKDIRFRPHVWLSEEWFSPDGIPGIAIPFYLAHPRLQRLERRFMHEVEGGNDKWLMRILRHETGHAIDTAFQLRRRKSWRDVFGKASRRYPSRYYPRPASRRFVLHLGHWYAQSHPTEDFAETFAVWLPRASRWRSQYAGWPALRKLEYVDATMRDLEGRRALRLSRDVIEPLSENTRTLREHYRRKQRRYELDAARTYDRRLLRVFGSAEDYPDGLHGQPLPAQGAAAGRATDDPPCENASLPGAACPQDRDPACTAHEPEAQSQPARHQARGAGHARAHHARHAAARPRELRPMTKKPLRVLVLVHETLVPPDSTEGYSAQQIDEWRTEYDVTSSLRAIGHEVKVLGMGDNLAELRSTIMEWKPDVAFNLLEEFQGIVTYDQYVVAFLELMRLPYTGCNPRGMMISRDKVLSKQILAYHRIATARYALLPRKRRYIEPRKLKFPAVREVGHRGRVARHLAGLDRLRRAEAARARRVHPRADQFGRAGRGIHRGARALHRRDGQRPPHDVPGLGAQFRHAAGRDVDRHPQGEVGPQVPAAPRHRHRSGARPAARPRAAAVRAA